MKTLNKILKSLDVIDDYRVKAELKRLDKFFYLAIVKHNLFEEQYDNVYDYLKENNENILDYEMGEIIDLIIDEVINER